MTRICKTCVLPETFPGVRFDRRGICNYCQSSKSRGALERQREDYRKRFETLLSTLGLPSRGYDVLVAYSGGKDSTYTLDILKNHYGLEALALTFDHGFVSPRAQENVGRVVEALGVDHITFKPNPHLIRKVFRFSLENEFHTPAALLRASSICNSCMGLVKTVALRTAVEKGIPLIAYGWSPGQAPIRSAILKNHASFLRKSQDFYLKHLGKAFGPMLKRYFLEDDHQEGKALPFNINLLGFFPYDEEEIYKRIRELGWKRPQDTDPNSTNCLINGFANQAHQARHHYHPYAMEMAQLVREGIVSRDDALCRLSEEPDAKVLAKVREQLGL